MFFMEVDDEPPTGETFLEEKDTSSEDDDDDSAEGDDALQQEIESVKEKLSTSPYHYQLHSDLMKLLRKSGEFEELQSTRERMSKIFPLTESLWLEWLEDEKKFADSEADHERIVGLFERAVKDYMCPEVWLEYAQYAIRWLDSEDGLSRIRSLMERALTAVGLHVTKGSSLWETYREFENAIVMTLQPAPGSVATPQHQEQLKKQMDRVESLFRRQLAIPLLDMEATYQELEEWVGEEIDENTRRSYQNALKQLKELKPYEEALLQPATSKLEEYQNYIQHETRSADPTRICCIYERAVEENCLNSELWTQYLKYLTRMLKHGDVIVEAHLRAVRNCPWVGYLWGQYLLALERNSVADETLDKVFEEALSAGLSSQFEYVELWQTRCEQLRRKFSTHQGDEAKQTLKDCFVSATQFITERLRPAYDEPADPQYGMWCLWARCEAECFGDKEKAVQVIQTLLRDDADARRKLAIYREYFNIERQYGGAEKVDQCRSILRQAVQNCAIMPDGQVGGLPDAEVACSMLLDFERVHGSLEDMDESMRRVVNKMTKVSRRKEKEAEDQAQLFKKRERSQKNRPKAGGRKRKLSEEASGSKEQRQNQNFQEKPKRPKTTMPATQDDGFKAPAGLPVRYGKQETSSSKTSPQTKKTPGPPPGFKPATAKGPPPGFNKQASGKGPPPGFQPPGATAAPPGFKGPPPGHPAGSSADVDESHAEVQGRIVPDADSVEKTEDEKTTVFVSNLDFHLENIEEKLRSVFCACGNITDIRLVQNNKGQFRGFTYIQFADESSVQKALELDRTEVEGRPMFVSPNVDKKKQPNFKVFKYGLGLEKHKLFVSNLSFHTTEETLSRLFSEHGNLRSIRIVTNRKGNSKGLAYVEYENEADAGQAVLKMDGKEIDDFAIRVAISNPPPRKPTGMDASASLGGGGGRDQFKGSRGRGRTQISMMPRTLRQPRKIENGSAGTPSTSSSGMSNKDFAALLLKK